MQANKADDAENTLGTAGENTTTTSKPITDLLSKLKEGGEKSQVVSSQDDGEQIKELDSSIVNVIRKDSPKAKLLNKIIKDETSGKGAAAADEAKDAQEAVVDSWLDFYDDNTGNLKDDLLDKVINSSPTPNQ